MSVVDAERTNQACCPECSDTEYRYAECRGDEKFRLLTPQQPRSAISAGVYCAFFCLGIGTIRRYDTWHYDSLYNDIKHNDTLRNDAQPKSKNFNIKHYQCRLC
jgi:hypothetical protein